MNLFKRIVKKVDGRVCQTVLSRKSESVRFLRIETYSKREKAVVISEG